MPLYIDLIGSLAAVITTVGWIPQIIRILKYRDASSISLVTNITLAVGVFLWLCYGIMIVSWPVMAANGMTLVLILTVLGLKFRYG